MSRFRFARPGRRASESEAEPVEVRTASAGAPSVRIGLKGETAGLKVAV